VRARGREWLRGRQNKLWDRGAMGFSTGEGWRVKRMRVGMRG
jgi:hypothetical protein